MSYFNCHMNCELCLWASFKALKVKVKWRVTLQVIADHEQVPCLAVRVMPYRSPLTAHQSVLQELVLEA